MPRWTLRGTAWEKYANHTAAPRRAWVSKQSLYLFGTILLEMVAYADDEKVDTVSGINGGGAIELKPGVVELPFAEHRQVIEKSIAKAGLNVQAQATAGNGQRISPKLPIFHIELGKEPSGADPYVRFPLAELGTRHYIQPYCVYDEIRTRLERGRGGPAWRGFAHELLLHVWR